MLKSAEFWIVTLTAVLAAALAITNAVLFAGNRTRQVEVAERAQYIQQSVQLEGLYREIVKALADLSVRNQDPALANLLSAQGITVTTNPAPAPTPAEPRKGAR
jgi:type VI protein secretion system component VasK